MAKKPLYIQLEPGAYPKDTDWLMMSAEERGCYHSLITFIACGNGSLPDNTENLAKLCNVSAEKMKSFLGKFENKFVKKNGKISHKRVTAEIKRAKKRLQVASTAGLKGAKKRWGSHSDPIKNPIKKPIAKGREGKGREVKGSKDTPLPPELDTENFKKAWTEWEQHRKEIKKKLTPTTIKRQLKTLSKYPVLIAIATINESIEKGWTGLFPERQNERKTIQAGQREPKPLTAETSQIGLVFRND